VNLSSHTILFQSDEYLSVGSQIELWIEWPVRLNERVALKLCARGNVVRVEDNCVAVEFSRHEFRTRNLDSSTGVGSVAAGAV